MGRGRGGLPGSFGIDDEIIKHYKEFFQFYPQRCYIHIPDFEKKTLLFLNLNFFSTYSPLKLAKIIGVSEVNFFSKINFLKLNMLESKSLYKLAT